MKKIYIVGLGPGNEAMMTAAAREAIDKSSVVVGYEVYVDLIRPLLAGKTVATTPMKREVDRCQMALEYALAGETVSMVCSGDAGVYGMAGVMMEVAREHPEVELSLIHIFIIFLFVGLFARFAFVSEGVLVFEAVTGYLAIALGCLLYTSCHRISFVACAIRLCAMRCLQSQQG